MQLLERETAENFTAFNRIKESPKSATLTHLDDWLSRLTWLQSLGNTQRLVEGIRSAKVKHLAEEARSLHATNLWDFPIAKRLTLLVCLIHQTTISTHDEILQMFLKRMSKLTTYSHKNRLYQAFHALGTVERTVFLLKFISDVGLREVIHRSTNKAEEYHNLEDWITFAFRGIIFDNVYEEQEKRIKYTGIIANCVMLDNTIEISAALNGLAKEGCIPTIDELAASCGSDDTHVPQLTAISGDGQFYPDAIIHCR